MVVLRKSLKAFFPFVGLTMGIFGAAPAEHLLESMEKEISAIIREVSPSVVSIYARSYQGNGWQRNVGSGVILDQQGYILTTVDVIRDASVIETQPSSMGVVRGSERYPAKLVGFDHGSRIAILKIEPITAQNAQLGDSDELKLGDWVITLGNSLGISPSVALGLISGFRKENGLIQMSTLTNPGNSGAPVLNSRGRVIGIVAGIETAANCLPGPHAVSLAIPINRVKEVARRLIKNGKVEYGWLGITTQQVDEGSEFDQGVFVLDVVKGSPAQRAGIRRGDVIIEYDGEETHNLHRFITRVKQTPIGKRVEVKLKRGGEEITVQVKLGKRHN